jgi:hypothetical protein
MPRLPVMAGRLRTVLLSDSRFLFLTTLIDSVNHLYDSLASESKMSILLFFFFFLTTCRFVADRYCNESFTTVYQVLPQEELTKFGVRLMRPPPRPCIKRCLLSGNGNSLGMGVCGRPISSSSRAHFYLHFHSSVAL